MQMLSNHFDYLRRFTLDMFTVHEQKAILAQGELMSTALLQYNLEERSIASSLMPELYFMRLNADDEPDYDYIALNIRKIISRYPSKNLIIAHSYIGRNAVGEIENLK
jgi:aspartate kinase